MSPMSREERGHFEISRLHAPATEANFHSIASEFGVNINPKNYKRIVKLLIEYGTPPENLDGYELSPVNAYLPTPRSRGVNNEAIGFSPLMALSSWLSMMTNRDDIAIAGASRIDWARGTRWASDELGSRIYVDRPDARPYSQIERVIESFRNQTSENSFMARTMYLRDPYDVITDAPYAYTFTTRGGALILNARLGQADVTQDFFYDVFIATMVQEFIARKLGHNMASAYFSLDSLRFMWRDSDLLTKIREYKRPMRSQQFTMAMTPMPRTISYDDLETVCDTFLDIYHRPRTLELVFPTLRFTDESCDEYCKYLLSVMCSWQWMGIDDYLFKDAFINIREDSWFTTMLMARDAALNEKMLLHRRHRNRVMNTRKLRYLKDVQEEKDNG